MYNYTKVENYTKLYFYAQHFKKSFKIVSTEPRLTISKNSQLRVIFKIESNYFV